MEPIDRPEKLGLAAYSEAAKTALSKSDFPQVELTCAELIQQLDNDIDDAKARIEAHDERLAIREAGLDDGLLTDQRAYAALERPERFPGEHDVARAWIHSSKTARRWNRNGNHT